MGDEDDEDIDEAEDVAPPDQEDAVPAVPEDPFEDEANVAPANEKRVDPSDGENLTQQRLRDKFAYNFTPTEVLQYWVNDCKDRLAFTRVKTVSGTGHSVAGVLKKYGYHYKECYKYLADKADKGYQESAARWTNSWKGVTGCSTYAIEIVDHDGSAKVVRYGIFHPPPQEAGAWPMLVLIPDSQQVGNLMYTEDFLHEVKLHAELRQLFNIVIPLHICSDTAITAGVVWWMVEHACEKVGGGNDTQRISVLGCGSGADTAVQLAALHGAAIASVAALGSHYSEALEQLTEDGARELATVPLRFIEDTEHTTSSAARLARHFARLRGAIKEPVRRSRRVRMRQWERSVVEELPVEVTEYTCGRELSVWSLARRQAKMKCQGWGSDAAFWSVVMWNEWGFGLLAWLTGHQKADVSLQKNYWFDVKLQVPEGSTAYPNCPSRALGATYGEAFGIDVQLKGWNQNQNEDREPPVSKLVIGSEAVGGPGRGGLLGAWAAAEALEGRPENAVRAGDHMFSVNGVTSSDGMYELLEARTPGEVFDVCMHRTAALVVKPRGAEAARCAAEEGLRARRRLGNFGWVLGGAGGSELVDVAAAAGAEAGPLRRRAAEEQRRWLSSWWNLRSTSHDALAREFAAWRGALLGGLEVPPWGPVLPKLPDSMVKLLAKADRLSKKGEDLAEAFFHLQLAVQSCSLHLGWAALVAEPAACSALVRCLVGPEPAGGVRLACLNRAGRAVCDAATRPFWELKRRDPEDGRLCTFAELVSKRESSAAGNPKAIARYWRDKCTPE